jgi:5'-3' exonuclease
VELTLICTPDKDLAQCVTEDRRVVLCDRRKDLLLDRAGVISKFGVPPLSIPDYLALVGDSADGYPGLPGFGPRTAALLLSRHGHLERIPPEPSRWEVPLRNASRLAVVLQESLDRAFLFRRLATLRTDAPTIASVEDLRWAGPGAGFDALCARLEAPRLASRAASLKAHRERPSRGA